MLLVNARKGPSRIHGSGLIAHEFIPKGAVIWRFEPGFDVRIPEQNIEQLSPAAHEQVLYYAFLDRETRTFILTSDDVRFTNHSSEPNTRSVGDTAVAVRNIRKGEEITACYQELNMQFFVSPVIVPTNGKELAMSPEEIYTPLQEAVEELHRRRADLRLCQAVSDFQCSYPPSFLNGEPVAMMARALHSADNEFDRFLSLCEQSGLAPLPLQTQEDRFCSRNKDKHMRGKLTFRLEKHIVSLRVMDFSHEGKRLCDIPTIGSLDLVSFHQELLRYQHPNHAERVTDVSDWFLRLGKIKPGYLHYLSLGIVSGIIFENFLPDDPQERHFLVERVIPSFKKAMELFGVKPLVVRLLTPEEENDPRMWEYPGVLYEFARGLIKNECSNLSLLT